MIVSSRGVGYYRKLRNPTNTSIFSVLGGFSRKSSLLSSRNKAHQNMKRKIFAFLLVLIPLSVSSSNADFILTPLNTFGNGDGWLAPAEQVSSTASVLGTVGGQRGMTYHGPLNEIYVVDRTGGPNVIRVLDGGTGATLRTLLNTSTPTPGLIAGGTFALNMISVGSDGAIYAANLAGVGTPFRVYRWADSLATTEPTLAFSANLTGANQVTGSRAGDSFAVFGGGATARLAVSGGGSIAATGVGLLDTTDGGVTFTQTTSVLTGATNGSFRLGLDFIDANNVIGKQTSADAFIAPLSATAAASNFALTSLGEAPLAYFGPNSLLATIDVNSSLVRLYNGATATGLGAFPVVTGNATFGALAGNGNGVGDLSFGIGPDGLRLYAMSTNQGLQAFSVTAVPEPSSMALAALGVVGIFARRRQLANRKQVS